MKYIIINKKSFVHNNMNMLEIYKKFKRFYRLYYTLLYEFILYLQKVIKYDIYENFFKHFFEKLLYNIFQIKYNKICMEINY